MQDQWKQHGYRQARFRQKQDNLYRRAASNEMPSMLQNQKGNFLEIVSSNMGVPKAQSKITLPEHVTEQYNFKKKIQKAGMAKAVKFGMHRTAPSDH
jgi:pyruvate-formate lyase